MCLLNDWNISSGIAEKRVHVKKYFMYIRYIQHVVKYKRKSVIETIVEQLFIVSFLWPQAVLEIPIGPPVRGRQLWRRTGNILLIFPQLYVYDLRFKAWGPTTFLTEFQTLASSNISWDQIEHLKGHHVASRKCLKKSFVIFVGRKHTALSLAVVLHCYLQSSHGAFDLGSLGNNRNS